MFPYHLRLLWSMLIAMMVLPRNLDNLHLYLDLAEISRVPVLTIARFILLSIWLFLIYVNSFHYQPNNHMEVKGDENYIS